MTSPSPKKRPTTPLNSQPTNSHGVISTAPAGHPFHGSAGGSGKVRVAVAVLAALAAALPLHAESTKLQWGNPANPFRKPTATSSDLKFVKPGVGSAPQQSGTPIKLAAFSEKDAPRLTSGRDPEPIRSVVVNRGDNADDDFRAAQLPSPAPSAGNPIPPEDLLRRPFGENAVEPAQLQTPMPDAAAAQPMGETGSALPPPTNPLRLNGQAPPANEDTFPGGTPPAQPDRGQYEPILPSGPGPDQSAPTRNTPAQEQKFKEEGEHAQQSCDESLKNLREYTVDKVKLNIVIAGTEGEDYPFECAIDDGQMFGGRCWEQVTYMWKASAMCHKPLYFEDEQLERYGHSFTPCLQPFVSGAHFFTRPFVLPYCMGVEPPCECIYALGHYRPGSCAPYMCNPIPLSLRGAAFEAGVVTGVSAALP